MIIGILNQRNKIFEYECIHYTKEYEKCQQIQNVKFQNCHAEMVCIIF